MERRRMRLTIVAAALAVFLAGCGAGASSDQATAGDAVDAVDLESVRALSGEFPTVSGEGIDLNSLEGQDVVLWFWAPW